MNEQRTAVEIHPTTGFAESTLAMYTELREQDPDAFTSEDADVLAVLDAWNGKALAVTPAARAAIVRGLTDLSNAEDAVATEPGRGHDVRRHARSAASGLSGLAMRVAMTGRVVRVVSAG